MVKNGEGEITSSWAYNWVKLSENILEKGGGGRSPKNIPQIFVPDQFEILSLKSMGQKELSVPRKMLQGTPPPQKKKKCH